MSPVLTSANAALIKSVSDHFSKKLKTQLHIKKEVQDQMRRVIKICSERPSDLKTFQGKIQKMRWPGKPNNRLTTLVLSKMYLAKHPKRDRWLSVYGQVPWDRGQKHTNKWKAYHFLLRGLVYNSDYKELSSVLQPCEPHPDNPDSGTITDWCMNEVYRAQGKIAQGSNDPTKAVGEKKSLADESMIRAAIRQGKNELVKVWVRSCATRKISSIPIEHWTIGEALESGNITLAKELCSYYNGKANEASEKDKNATARVFGQGFLENGFNIALTSPIFKNKPVVADFYLQEILKYPCTKKMLYTACPSIVTMLMRAHQLALLDHQFGNKECNPLALLDHHKNDQTNTGETLLQSAITSMLESSIYKGKLLMILARYGDKTFDAQNGEFPKKYGEWMIEQAVSTQKHLLTLLDGNEQQTFSGRKTLLEHATEVAIAKGNTKMACALLKRYRENPIPGINNEPHYADQILREAVRKNSCVMELLEGNEDQVFGGQNTFLEKAIVCSIKHKQGELQKRIFQKYKDRSYRHVNQGFYGHFFVLQIIQSDNDAVLFLQGNEDTLIGEQEAVLQAIVIAAIGHKKWELLITLLKTYYNKPPSGADNPKLPVYFTRILDEIARQKVCMQLLKGHENAPLGNLFLLDRVTYWAITSDDQEDFIKQLFQTYRKRRCAVSTSLNSPLLYAGILLGNMITAKKDILFLLEGCEGELILQNTTIFDVATLTASQKCCASTLCALLQKYGEKTFSHGGKIYAYSDRIISHVVTKNSAEFVMQVLQGSEDKRFGRNATCLERVIDYAFSLGKHDLTRKLIAKYRDREFRAEGNHRSLSYEACIVRAATLHKHYGYLREFFITDAAKKNMSRKCYYLISLMIYYGLENSDTKFVQQLLLDHENAVVIYSRSQVPFKQEILCLSLTRQWKKTMAFCRKVYSKDADKLDQCLVKAACGGQHIWFLFEMLQSIGSKASTEITKKKAFCIIRYAVEKNDTLFTQIMDSCPNSIVVSKKRFMLQVKHVLLLQSVRLNKKKKTQEILQKFSQDKCLGDGIQLPERSHLLTHFFSFAVASFARYQKDDFLKDCMKNYTPEKQGTTSNEISENYAVIIRLAISYERHNFVLQELQSIGKKQNVIFVLKIANQYANMELFTQVLKIHAHKLSTTEVYQHINTAMRQYNQWFLEANHKHNSAKNYFSNIRKLRKATICDPLKKDEFLHAEEFYFSLRSSVKGKYLSEDDAERLLLIIHQLKALNIPFLNQCYVPYQTAHGPEVTFFPDALYSLLTTNSQMIPPGMLPEGALSEEWKTTEKKLLLQSNPKDIPSIRRFHQEIVKYKNAIPEGAQHPPITWLKKRQKQTTIDEFFGKLDAQTRSRKSEEKTRKRGDALSDPGDEKRVERSPKRLRGEVSSRTSEHSSSGVTA